MKIFITNPPFFKNFNRQVRWSAKTSGGIHPPVYLAYAAAILEKNHDVKLLDAIASNTAIEDFYKMIDKQKPDFVIMDTSTPSILNDMNIAKKIKENRPDIKIVLVGPHVSAMPENTMKIAPWVDFLTIGEYDYTLPALIENSEKSNLDAIDGIVYRDNKKIVITKNRKLIENLDDLPYPDRDQLPIDKYRDTLLTPPFTFIISGRGCPFRCTFCLWPQVMYGRKLRLRNEKKVVDEVEYCINRYNLKTFKFFDDTFTVMKDRVNKICQELIKRKIKTPWICNARVDTLDKETMQTMKKSGCYLFKVGVESGSQKILDDIRKDTKIEQIKNFFKLTKEVGIKTFASFMIGLPNDTEETIRATIDLAKTIEPDMAQFVILSPLPGTEMFNDIMKRGWIEFPIKWDDYLMEQGYINVVFKHPRFSEEELKDICGKMWKEFYLRPKFVVRRIKKGISDPSELKRNIMGIKKVFRY
jgi:radical SAM superfamily enzyme YgiQ (UPF0313 family)